MTKIIEQKNKIELWKEQIESIKNKIDEVVGEMTVDNRYKVASELEQLEQSLYNFYEEIEKLKKKLPWKEIKVAHIEIKLAVLKSNAKAFLDWKY